MFKLDDVALETVAGGNGGTKYTNSFNFNKNINSNTALVSADHDLVVFGMIGVSINQTN